jgi:hypothetical protein
MHLYAVHVRAKRVNMQPLERNPLVMREEQSRSEGEACAG